MTPPSGRVQHMAGGVYMRARVQSSGIDHAPFMEAPQIFHALEDQILPGARKRPQRRVGSKGKGQIVNLGAHIAISIALW